MAKPVNYESFWETRIKNAEEAGDIRYSVYITLRDDWENIEKVHAELIEKYIKPDDTVLDVACGYGRFARVIHPDKYLGFDFSPDFIELAREYYPEHHFDVENALDLPYRDNQFDWAVCGSFKEMIVGNQGQEVWDKMEKEITRVCKKFLILEYTNPYEHEIRE